MPMFMLNGKQYGGNGGNYQVAKMSKADYDALTDAQKNDGTLRIVVDSTGNSVNYMSAQVAGAKTDDTHTNLLNPTLETTTINGVTCTNNGDGTYTLNGNATNDVLFPLETSISTLELPKTYRLVGCPSGGSGSTFELNTIKIVGSSRSVLATDRGNGATFDYPSGATYEVRIRIANGAVFPSGGVTFKPMLTTDLSATYDSFVKYSGSEERINEQVASLHDSSKGVITNLINSTMGDTTVGDVTCTANGDGTYTFNGTTTTSKNFFPLPIGQGYEAKSGVTYHLSGCPKGGSSTTYELIAEAELGTTYKKQYAHDYGNGVSFTMPKADIDAGYKLRITISIRSNVTNLTFKPMLTTDLDATYNDYVPYSGDGRLNENVAEIYTNVERLTKSVNPTNNAFIWKTYTGKADEEGVFIIQNVSGYVPIFCLIESPAKNALDVCKGVLYNNVSKTFAIDTYMSKETVTIKVLYVKDS